MKTAIATVCLSGALGEKLEAIARAGFQRVEIFENDLLTFNGSPADVRRMIEERIEEESSALYATARLWP